MTELTLLLYTANRVPAVGAARMRARLAVQAGGADLLCVSQQPVTDFGRNICVGPLDYNKYNAYWQIYVGALNTRTEYVATIDDDTLYAPEHFVHRPPPGEFWYEMNCWLCQDGKDHYWRTAEPEKRGGMWGCIARTETLVANLAARFDKFPDPQAPLPGWWGEPGIRQGDRLYGRRDGLRRVLSARPCVVFIHEASMGYTQFSRWHRRYGQPAPENTAAALDDYGTVSELRARYWEGEKVAA